MKFVDVEKRRIPVAMQVDVCVIGGGISGVCAAVSAARNGAKTLLVERWAYCGGMSTAAMVNMWHMSDGEKQVITGIIDELIHRLHEKDEKYGVSVVPGFPVMEKVDKTHDFSPEILKHVYDDILTEAGVIPLYYTVFSECVMDGERIDAVVLETKQGRIAVKSKFFVDASGDADLACSAGVPCEYGREEDGLVQGMTMMYQLRDIDSDKASKIPYLGEKHQELMQRMAEDRDKGLIPNFGPIDFAYYAQGGFANMNPASGNPTDSFELTDCTIRTRRNIFKYIEWFRNNVPGFENASLAQSAACIGIRESRRIKGKYVFKKQDMFDEARFEDAIGHGFWCIDVHDPKGSGSTSWENKSEKFWLEPGHNYQIPFRIMVPEVTENLLVAGRCVSATHIGIASLRIQSHCAVMGQAAGAALGICTAKGIGISELDMKLLRTTLKEQGAYIED